jgi:hypothetical protein
MSRAKARVRSTLRPRLNARARTLRATGVTLVQTAVAAGTAWLLAHDVLGHKNAFFAPVAAVIALGISPGGRRRRAVEMVIGVAVGIAVGELLTRAIGTGAAQVGLVVLLAMTAAILLGGGPLIASQAASSAVLVATVRIGRRSRADAVRRRTRGRRRRDRRAGPRPARPGGDRAREPQRRRSRARARARAFGRRAGRRSRQALVLAEETTRIAPSHWRECGRIARYEGATIYLELAVRNARVLARAAVRAVELEPRISPRLPTAIRGLATAVRRLEHELDQGGEHEQLREGLLVAAADASEALNEERGFAIDVLVGQVRSIVLDLLRALGLDQASATDEIRAAAGEREAVAPRSRRASSRRPGTGRA